MSPSKLRKLSAYSEGRDAFHTAEVRDPTPNPYADDTYGNRAAAWSLGFQEERDEFVRPPTRAMRFAAAMKVEDLASAVDLMETEDDVRLILHALVERLEPPL